MSSKDKSSKEILQRAYDLKSKQDTRELYRDWASTYEQTMVDGLTYSSPQNIADLLQAHVLDKQALIADIGCGTGLTGQAAFDRGYTNLVGLDFSDEMLEQARKRNIYQSLLNADLTETLDIETGQYEIAISSGIFTYGHLDASCLDEIFRIIKKDGLFICVVRLQVWEPLGFADKFANMEHSGLIQILESKEFGNYQTSQSADGRYLVIKKV